MHDASSSGWAWTAIKVNASAVNKLLLNRSCSRLWPVVQRTTAYGRSPTRLNTQNLPAESLGLLAKPPAELLGSSELSNWLAPSVARSGSASSAVVKLGDVLVGNAQDLAGVVERQPQFINQDTDRVTRQSSCLFLFSGCLTEEALGPAHLLDHGRRRREVLDLDSDLGGIHLEPRSHEVSGHVLDVADAPG